VDGVQTRPVFYYDVGSPWSYLAGERAAHALGTVPEWEPVLAAALPGPPQGIDRTAVERAASEQRLLEVRWPEPFPFDSLSAMRVAAYAKSGGRAVAFSLAAMRQAFAAGRDLGVTDNVLLAAAACELHPRAVLKALESRAVAESLDEATAAAVALGVTGVPAIAVGDRLFSGPDAPERAAALIVA
jgi:2-hydroxychromene-2-carboxylate isomerase